MLPLRIERRERREFGWNSAVLAYHRAAPETRAAAERARLLIEQAEAMGEPPEDRLLLFSVLYSFWVASNVAFDGDAMRQRLAFQSHGRGMIG
jgi:hypothetical protein